MSAGLKKVFPGNKEDTTQPLMSPQTQDLDGVKVVCPLLAPIKFYFKSGGLDLSRR